MDHCFLVSCHSSFLKVKTPVHLLFVRILTCQMPKTVIWKKDYLYVLIMLIILCVSVSTICVTLELFVGYRIILDNYHPDKLHYIYMSKNVRFCGYFWKPKGVCEQNSGKHWLRWLTRRLITEVECKFMVFCVCYFKTLSVAKLYSILICVRISDETTLSGLKSCTSPNLSATNPP